MKENVVELRNKVIPHFIAVDHDVISQSVTGNIPSAKSGISGILREYSQ